MFGLSEAEQLFYNKMTPHVPYNNRHEEGQPDAQPDVYFLVFVHIVRMFLTLITHFCAHYCTGAQKK